MKIINCYDSHVHWLATGEHETRLNLASLKTARDVLQLKVAPYHFRNEWLIGFGWDQNRWEEKAFPHRSILDEAFGLNQPVCFSRADGHAAWVNTETLKRIGLLDATNQPTAFSRQDPMGGFILRDPSGVPTGVLVDTAMEPVFKLIPSSSSQDVQAHLIEGMKVFNQNGFTHIRDLSCDETQWQEMINLESQSKLTLAVEQFFHSAQPSEFDRALQHALYAKRSSSRLVRLKGIKIYYDGALGSEGALLSAPYACCSEGRKGLALMSQGELEDMIERTWRSQFEIAVHVIGDEASHQVIESACRVWDKGMKGRLHLEHLEMGRPESLQRLIGRDVVVHMQPCHWLSDRSWVDQKLGPLTRYLFPWQFLENKNIPFDFGSDSPIERPNVLDTKYALEDSAEWGIPRLQKDWALYHSHRDLDWTPGTYSEWKDGRVHSVFLGQEIRMS